MPRPESMPRNSRSCATEITHIGAKNGAFPPSFIKLNRNEVPTGSLLFTTLTVQLCLFLV